MKFQSQPNTWSCSVASAAMALDVPLHDLIARIGHDGSAIVFPQYRDPMCRAGFHIQEIADAALEYGYAMLAIEARPMSTPNGVVDRDLWSEDEIKARFEAYLDNYSGVVAGERLDGKYWHNVAWNHEYNVWSDPSGPILPREHAPLKPAVFNIFFKTDTFFANKLLREIVKKGEL